ncbi:MAG: hypothetical protein JXA04_03175 [Gammaproteobacteria bacterium]|nr:hypothetical protein [Gammaproteobacteria bacterium]
MSRYFYNVDDGYAISTTEYQGLISIATNANYRRKLIEKNAIGQTVRTVDDEGGLSVETRFGYDSQGSLTTTTVDNNTSTAITIKYDKRGNKEYMIDPDMGRWDYDYNGYGELKWQQDAKGQITEIDYDKLGRMTERREWPDENNDGSLEAVQTSYWYYDDLAAGGAYIGKLYREVGPEGTSKTYSYYANGLLERTDYEVGMSGLMQTFSVEQTYDAYGRVRYISYPVAGTARLTTENVYSPYGGLWYVLDTGFNLLDDSDDSVFWIAKMVDARGQIMQEFLRNRNTINNSYNRATGWLQKVESWDVNTDMIQQTRYEFDAFGNVQARNRFKPWVVNPDGSFYAGANEEIEERFAYDSLDRLTGSVVTRDGMQTSSKAYDYDRLGNFLYKDTTDDTYVYNTCSAGSRAAGPHAVCAAKGSNFSYDANGNMVESTGARARTLKYSSFNKPIEITENGSTVHFYYGADRSRIFKVSDPNTNGQREYTFYVGLGANGNALYEQKALLDSGGNVIRREHHNFIYAGAYHKGQAFAMQVFEELEDNDPSQPNFVSSGGTEYYHRDHLGSIIAITNERAAIATADGVVQTQLMSFDAFGLLRNSDWSDLVDGQYQSTRTNRMFTGHESIPEVGLIHMNGRVYDPELGLFLSPDSVIQAASYSQNYNRYSYVLNNPIRYNDPSGHWVWFVVAAIGKMMAWQAATTFWVTVAATFAYTYVKTGDVGLAFLATWSAAVAYGIGSSFQGMSSTGAYIGKAFVHGITQGAVSEMMGGDFRSGFVGGFAGSLMGPIAGKIDNIVLSTAVAAMVGGTVSELSGGKFRNGARSAAVVHLMNDRLHDDGSAGKTAKNDQIKNISVDQKNATVTITYRDGRTVVHPAAVADGLMYPGSDNEVSGKIVGVVKGAVGPYENTGTSWQQDNNNPYGPRYLEVSGTGGKHIHGTNGPLAGGIDYIGGKNPADRMFTHGCARLTNETIMEIAPQVQATLDAGYEIGVQFHGKRLSLELDLDLGL